MSREAAVLVCAQPDSVSMVSPHDDDEPAMDQLALLASWMLAGPRYLDRVHLAADVQLQWFVRERMRGGESAFGGYIDRHRSFDLLLRANDRAIRASRASSKPVAFVRKMISPARASAPMCSAPTCSIRGGHLTSVDNDDSHCAFARQWTRCFGDAVDVCVADSVAWLRDAKRADRPSCTWTASIPNRPAAPSMASQKSRQLIRRLRGRSLVACDDTGYRGKAFHGKGALLVPWLMERGWRILYSGHQTVLSL